MIRRSKKSNIAYIVALTAVLSITVLSTKTYASTRKDVKVAESNILKTDSIQANKSIHRKVNNVSNNGTNNKISQIDVTKKEENLSIPTNITFDISTNSIVVKWNLVSEATGYEIEVDGQVYDCANQNTYKVLKLTSGTSHSFRIRAKNGNSYGLWSELITKSTLVDNANEKANNTVDNEKTTNSGDKVQKPSDNDSKVTDTSAGEESLQPISPKIDSCTNNSVKLSWSKNPKYQDIKAYQIYRDGNLITSVSGDTLSFVDLGLKSNTDYVYTIRSVSSTDHVSKDSEKVAAHTFLNNTVLSGVIDKDTTLDSNSGAYTINGCVEIKQGVTLYLGDGVVIKALTSDSFIKVDGKLSALGFNKVIIFTSADENVLNTWKGIEVTSNGSFSAFNVEIRNANINTSGELAIGNSQIVGTKNSTPAVLVNVQNGAKIVMTNNKIDGVVTVASDPSGYLEISDNKISDNLNLSNLGTVKANINSNVINGYLSLNKFSGSDIKLCNDQAYGLGINSFANSKLYIDGFNDIMDINNFEASDINITGSRAGKFNIYKFKGSHVEVTGNKLFLENINNFEDSKLELTHNFADKWHINNFDNSTVVSEHNLNVDGMCVSNFHNSALAINNDEFNHDLELSKFTESDVNVGSSAANVYGSTSGKEAILNIYDYFNSNLNIGDKDKSSSNM